VLACCEGAVSGGAPGTAGDAASTARCSAVGPIGRPASTGRTGIGATSGSATARCSAAGRGELSSPGASSPEPGATPPGAVNDDSRPPAGSSAIARWGISGTVGTSLAGAGASGRELGRSGVTTGRVGCRSGAASGVRCTLVAPLARLALLLGRVDPGSPGNGAPSPSLRGGWGGASGVTGMAGGTASVGVNADGSSAVPSAARDTVGASSVGAVGCSASSGADSADAAGDASAGGATALAGGSETGGVALGGGSAGGGVCTAVS
jgi:hypothetical protein